MLRVCLRRHVPSCLFRLATSITLLTLPPTSSLLLPDEVLGRYRGIRHRRWRWLLQKAYNAPVHPASIISVFTQNQQIDLSTSGGGGGGGRIPLGEPRISVASAGHRWQPDGAASGLKFLMRRRTCGTMQAPRAGPFS